MMFETFGKLFSFPSMKYMLTEKEQDSLSCLLDRAERNEGNDDCILLCVQKGILLLRLVRHDTMQADGFLFPQEYASMVWVNLPEFISELYCLDLREVCTDYMVQLEVRQPPLYKQLQKFTCTQLQPENIGFTHIDPALYGNCGIAWTELHPQHSTHRPAPIIDPLDAEEADKTDCVLVPPTLLRRRWLLRDTQDPIAKLDSITEDTANWYELDEEIHSYL